jgi:hypothetical protein
MNEKIKRLLRQIKGETYSPLVIPTTIYGTSKLYGMTEEEINQFAELIVTKCISVVYGSNYNKADALAEEIYHKFWD